MGLEPPADETMLAVEAVPVWGVALLGGNAAALDDCTAKLVDCRRKLSSSTDLLVLSTRSASNLTNSSVDSGSPIIGWLASGVGSQSWILRLVLT